MIIFTFRTATGAIGVTIGIFVIGIIQAITDALPTIVVTHGGRLCFAVTIPVVLIDITD